MNNISCDIIIVGAGPAGTTMALMLAGSGLQVTIIDKDRFPRDKICGDALSGQVLSILKRMPDNIYDDFLATVPKSPSYGTRFVSPGSHIADISFSTGPGTHAPGYICPRKEFDAFLASKLRDYGNIRFIEGEKVIGVRHKEGGMMTAVTAHSVVKGKVVAGADGTHSVVRSLAGNKKPVRTHLCTGIRAYFEGVTGFHPENYIELFYLKELLPFYFWIFPEVNGRCNAGLAVLQSEISRKKLNAGALFDDILHNHPLIAHRFEAARMARRAEAHALPLGVRPGPFSGNGFLMLGDAASLVDPFTGEGIGNAMASGEVAARVLKTCFAKGDYSKTGMREYEVQMRNRIGNDLRASFTLQRMARYPWLFDLVVRKLNSAVIKNEELRSRLSNPVSLARLLFAK